MRPTPPRGAVAVDATATRLAAWSERRWPRLGLSAIAGACICFSLPPWGWWPLTIVGIGLWATLLQRRPAAQRFWVGAMVGFTWFLPSTLWMVAFTPPGWVAGVGVWFPVVCGATAVVCPPRAAALALPGAIVVSEWVRWHAPFGGVPLSVIADTHGRGPLLPVARVAGALGVSLAVAACGAVLATLLTGDGKARRLAVGALAGVTLTTVTGARLVPDSQGLRTARVAVVQGGGAQRTLSERTDYSLVLDRHLEAARSIEVPVDLVVLPENIVNVSGFFEGSREEALIAELARDLETTVVAGVVEDQGERSTFRNAAIAFDPDGDVIARYDKVRRVPFGEYTPMRSLMTTLAEATGSFVPPRDALPGTAAPVLETDVGRLGVAVSWEVFFPRRLRAAAQMDADVMLNPTNGSSYWLTQVQSQQINQSALRAVETGRWLLQSAPTGFSAIIDPSGNVVARTGLGESAALVHTVTLGGPRTLATRLGELPAWVISLTTLAIAWLRQRRADGDDVLGPTDGDISPIDRDSSV